MSTIEDIGTTVKSYTETQNKIAEAHTAFFRDLGSSLEEGNTALAQATTLHLETLLKAESYTAAFEINVKFEDNINAKLASFYDVNAEAAKTLMTNTAKLLGLVAEKPETVSKPIRKKAA